jgi:hypothetical protein
MRAARKIPGFYLPGLCARGTCTNEAMPRSRYCRLCQRLHFERETDDPAPKVIPIAGQTQLYAITAGPAVKFGVARNIARRLVSLQVGNHESLKVLAWIACTPDLEGAVHRWLASSCIRGEWHQHDYRARALIERMQTGDLKKVLELLATSYTRK